MTSLGSLREEDLDEICIDSPTNNWLQNDSAKRHSRIRCLREQKWPSTHLARRSYSQPEIHFSLNSSSISPDELRFSSEISRTASDINWDKTPPNPEPFFGESCRPLKQYCSSHHQSTLSDGTPYSPVQRTKSFNLPRYDPSPVEERVKSMQSLLASIYQDDPSQNRYLPDSLTESFQSDASHASPRRLTVETLQSFGRKRLVSETRFLLLEIEKANQRLVKVVRQRSYYRAKQATKCAILSAILMANSSKTSADSKLRFSLEPPSLHEGVEEWKRAMRAMARVPGGLPSLVRCKLWSTLGELYMHSSGFDWEEIRSKAFSEKLRPDDSKIHSQILKDLHRTGWSEFDDEKKLKQVLLAYARYNNEIGYCQGFNVIAALILQVVEYRTDVALKVMIFLIEHVMPRGYFDQSLGALSVDMVVMKDLMLQRLPATIQHLETLQNASENEYEPPLPNIFSMHWFLTLFATCLPRNCVMRVWDALMLQGSEILLRTAIALWLKMSRKILRTSTADEFYTVMGKLCKELAEMNEEEQDHMMTVVYTMAEFPYPGLAELREKYRWNIQPFSPTFKLLRRSVDDILHDDHSDKTSCSPCDIRRKIDGELTTWCDLRSLEKQYSLTKKRQKQAAVIISNAYMHGLQAHGRPSKALGTGTDLPLPSLPPVFNHLLVGHMLVRDSLSKLPTALTGGTMQLTATVIQPSDQSARVQRCGAVMPATASSRSAGKNEDCHTVPSENSETDKICDKLFSNDTTMEQVYITAVKSEGQRTAEYRDKLKRSKLILERASPSPALQRPLPPTLSGPTL